jgi:Zn-dependent M28 family amino/carboxypeptidase
MKSPIIAVSAAALLLAVGMAPVLSAAAADSTTETASLPQTPIDPQRLSAHVRVLSSDAFEGRGPATPGEVKTLDYVTHQFQSLGMEPGGDLRPGGKRAWTQDAPLRRFEVKTAPKMSFSDKDGVRQLHQGEEAVVHTLRPVKQVDITKAPLVFVGFGVKAPERNWDDFKGVDLKGKIAVVLINDPDFETPPGHPTTGRFDGKAMTYYGRWTYKYEEAARQGALGMLIVHETAPASYGWATVKNSNSAPQFDVVRPSPRKAHPLLEGWIQRDQAVDLFRRAGLDFEAEKARAQTADFHPVTLQGQQFSARFAVAATTIVSHNIVALLPGRTHPDEYVFYSAHWDHLGVGLPDARGDRIYNGAVDNAGGIASILELARVFASQPRTERTVGFIAFTAEEKGLLGSEYYASHPLYPLAKTVAVYNRDGLETNGPARDISTSGNGRLSLQDDIAAAAAAQGRRFTPDAVPEAGHFFRSDHFPLAKRGVPAVSVNGGLDLYVGGEAAGRAAETDYVVHRYHQPADEWRADWDLRGQAIDDGLIYALGRDLANSRRWPAWQDGSEFKAVRDATAAARK